MKRMLKLGLPAAVSLGVVSCSTISTPPVSVPDSTIPLATIMATLPGKVVYAEKNGLPQAVPAALKDLTLSGNATYRSRGGTLTRVNMYVRSSLTGLTGCTVVPAPAVTPNLYVCDAVNEKDQKIGTLDLQGGVARPFTLSGPALDTAAHAGSAYFGLELVNGVPLDGESVLLSDVKAQARI